MGNSKVSSKHNSGGVPSGPGTLLVCQSAMPKHLKGKKNKKVSLGLGPMVYLVFKFCQILRGGGGGGGEGFQNHYL